MFWHRCHGENGEGPEPPEGTFFDFFSNAVRARNRFWEGVSGRGVRGCLEGSIRGVWGVSFGDRIGVVRRSIGSSY